MLKLYRFLYSVFFVNFLYLVFIVSAFFNLKTRKAFLGRLGVWKRLKNKISGLTKIKRVWFHVSSVGEMEQAMPLMRIINDKRPDIDIILTYFSPSAVKAASRIDFIACSEYLPVDTYLNSKKLFTLLKPSLLVFVKFDIWPNIIWEATTKEVPSVLIDGTLHRKSLRYSNFLGQRFYNSVYKCIDFIAAVSDSDYQRFSITAPAHKNIKILGDTRFDQVAFRAKASETLSKIPASLKILKNKYTLICGSIWEADDKHIFYPLLKIMEKYTDLNLVLVPHEPSRKNINNYISNFEMYNPECLTSLYSAEVLKTRVIVVDTVGVLAELYRLGDLAYVGGAFSTGVHNVMEPAIMGLPVMFGPFYFNSPEAEKLVSLNCCFSGSSSDEFLDLFNNLIGDRDNLKQLGKRAAEYIFDSLGAAERCYLEILKYL